MMKAEAIGLYIHIPFCIKKCNYCDFCSFCDLSSDVRSKYIKRLAEEIKSYKREPKINIDTLFFGGGTPSLLSCDEFSYIVAAVNESFNVLPGAEFTVEMNPKTADADKLDLIRKLGVNRLSIGLQTIHENERKILGRIHNFEDFLSAYELALQSGFENISVDVMYGIPEQTLSSFKGTLDAVLSLSPAHISAYSLILEEKTPLWDKRDSLRLPSENEELAMYSYLCERLGSAGYSHYEISNYAKPNMLSRHNLKYWQNKEYIGVGISAHSYFDGARYGNSSQMIKYLSDDYSKHRSLEVINRDSYAYEYLMLGLRLKSGISIAKYKSISGIDLLSLHSHLISSYISGGYVSVVGDTLSLTERGFYVSNTIISSFL